MKFGELDKEYQAIREEIDRAVSDVLVHRQMAYTGSDHAKGPLSVTKHVAGRILSLPMYPQMRGDEVIAVIAAVRSFFT